MIVAKIGDFSIPITLEKSIQIKSLQVLIKLRREGYNFSLSHIRRMFEFKPFLSSSKMFEEIVESLKKYNYVDKSC